MQKGIQRIDLPSKLVSRHHITLKEVEGSWMLFHLGTNETFVNDVVVPGNQPSLLNQQDEIKVGEYLLNLVSKTDIKKVEVAGEELKVSELEKNIHEELLKLLELRKGSGSMNLDDPANRQLIDDLLNQVIENHFARLTIDDIKSIAKLSTYRRISYEVTAVGGKSSRQSWSVERQDAIHSISTQFNNLVKSIIRKLNLGMDKRSLEEDCRIIDERFDEIYQGYELDFTPGVYKNIGQSYIKGNILDLIFGLGPLQELMDMDSISEIMVVSKDKIFIEKFGVVEDSRRQFISDALLLATIERIVSPLGRRIDKSSPMVDAHLPDGSRVNAIIPPLALKGPCVTIRKFSATPFTMEDLISFGALTPQVGKFLKACVLGAKNIVVSGGTGSGKTTLLNCLSEYIPSKERIVTIEDTAELQLKQEHVVTLESRPPNMEGKGEVSIRDLVKNALRMRPDRIVVGECRGAETLDMLQAMNTGHDGSMTTGHANSPEDMMRRLEVMVLTGADMPSSAIREQIVSAVDIVVQLNRLPSGARKITHVSEVVGIDHSTGRIITEDIFALRASEQSGDEGIPQHTGYIPTFVQSLLEKRILTIEQFF